MYVYELRVKFTFFLFLRFAVRFLRRSVNVLLEWIHTGSNRRPSECKSDALPAELWTPVLLFGFQFQYSIAVVPCGPKRT